MGSGMSTGDEPGSPSDGVEGGETEFNVIVTPGVCDNSAGGVDKAPSTLRAKWSTPPG